MKIIKKGFTLIELLIVITIIGIMTAVVSTNLSSARSRARDTRRKADLRSVEQSLRLYYNDNQAYPRSNGSFVITACTSGTCNWGSAFTNTIGTTTYISSLPRDPSYSSNNTTPTYLYYSASDDTFILQATLENLSDPDIAESQSKCISLYSNIDISTSTDYVICVQ